MRSLIFTALMTLALLVLSPLLRADSVEQINAGSQNTLVQLKESASGVEEVVRSAAGVLVFPDVVKLGFGVGGQYGEGVLLVKGVPEAYYATAGASYGLQLGVQSKSEVIVFRTEEALDKFRDSSGWQAGVDGSVALIKMSAGASIDTSQISEPVVGFILSSKGLMYNLTFEGAKITRIAR